MKNTALSIALGVLAACTTAPQPPEAQLKTVAPVALQARDLALLNRLTYGATAASAAELARLGEREWIERQLKPPPGDDLPQEAAEQVAALTITRHPVEDLVNDLTRRRRALLDERRKGMQADGDPGLAMYQRELNRLAREAMTRSLLRALYSPWQLREQMTWFWSNHFSVFAGKAGLRAMLGDYEERALRPHALGRFRDLLGAVAHHPAMLVYLDNAQNARGKLNAFQHSGIRSLEFT